MYQPLVQIAALQYTPAAVLLKASSYVPYLIKISNWAVRISCKVKPAKGVSEFVTRLIYTH